MLRSQGPVFTVTAATGHGRRFGENRSPKAATTDFGSAVMNSPVTSALSQEGFLLSVEETAVLAK
jgi:hypothetical protein